MPTSLNNRRATRSRFSSPAQTSNGTAADQSTRNSRSGSAGVNNGSDGQRELMKRWLEPPLNSRPSYQDDGLVRQGVVESMAPLGTMPKAGYFKKLPVPPPEQTPIRKIVLKRPAAATATGPAVPAIATPVQQPLPVTPSVAEEDETEEEGDNLDSFDGEEGMEGNTPAPASTIPRHPLRPSSSSHDDDDRAPRRTPHWPPPARRSMSLASAGGFGSVASPQQYAPAPATTKEQLQDFIDGVIDKATEEALAHGRYPTAYALQKIAQHERENVRVLIMIQKVFSQSAEADTLEEFARLLHRWKKEGKSGDIASTSFASWDQKRPFSPLPPQPAPYTHLIKIDVSPLHLGRKVRRDHHRRSPPQLQPQPQPQPEPQPEPQKDPTPVPPSPPPNHVVQDVVVDQEPVPEQKGEPEQETQREGHVRKKRKSNRHHDSTSKMATNGVNGKAKTDSPARRRTRADSVSSSSSLSSARSMTPPDGIQEEDEDGDVLMDASPISPAAAPAAPSVASPPAAAAAVDSNSAAAPQPITGRRRSNAAKKSRNVSPAQPTPTASPTPQPLPAAALQPVAEQQDIATEQPYDMPAVLDTPLFPNLTAKKSARQSNQNIVFHSKVGRIPDDDPKLLLRQSAKKVTNERTQAATSFTRDSVPKDVPSLDFGEESTGSATPAPPSRSRASLPASRSTPGPTAASNARSTRSSRKRSHDELEDPTSPTVQNFPSEVASTAANSRAGTPVLRAAKKPRTSVRVKSSPMKKKSGTSAGIPRASGERSSPVGYGALSREQDDNDDYCSSCGGNGNLICCDGCTRSFHLNCLDPLMPDPMPAEWFCNVCLSNRQPPQSPAYRGPFALLLENLDAKNSSAFRLPDDVRDYFEGVKTGPEGEYEEIGQGPAPKPVRKKKNEEDQTPDFFKQRDTDNNAVLCHHCNKATQNDRPIVPCSLCGLWWHIDCVDPPLANPPAPRSWRCPCHVDDLLAKIPGALGPAHRHRKIKGASVIRPAFSRGFVNNGFIEVDLDDSGGEDQSGWKDVASFGRTCRLPAKGIKLDFLSRTRTRGNRKGKPIPPLDPVQPLPVLSQRSLEEQQAARNLALLSSQESARMDGLISALLNQANPTIINLMAQGDPERLAGGDDPLSPMDEQSLRAMLAQVEKVTGRIKQRLSSSSKPEEIGQQKYAPEQPQKDDKHDSVVVQLEDDQQEEEAEQEQIAPVPSLVNSSTTSSQAGSSSTADDVDMDEDEDRASIGEGKAKEDEKEPALPTGVVEDATLNGVSATTEVKTTPAKQAKDGVMKKPLKPEIIEIQRGSPRTSSKGTSSIPTKRSAPETPEKRQENGQQTRQKVDIGQEKAASPATSAEKDEVVVAGGDATMAEEEPESSIVVEKPTIAAAGVSRDNEENQSATNGQDEQEEGAMDVDLD